MSIRVVFVCISHGSSIYASLSCLYACLLSLYVHSIDERERERFPRLVSLLFFSYFCCPSFCTDRELFNEIHEVYQSGLKGADLPDSLLEKTSKAFEANSGSYTAWMIRRRCLLSHPSRLNLSELGENLLLLLLFFVALSVCSLVSRPTRSLISLQMPTSLRLALFFPLSLFFCLPLSTSLCLCFFLSLYLWLSAGVVPALTCASVRARPASLSLRRTQLRLLLLLALASVDETARLIGLRGMQKSRHM